MPNPWQFHRVLSGKELIDLGFEVTWINKREIKDVSVHTQAGKCMGIPKFTLAGMEPSMANILLAVADAARKEGRESVKRELQETLENLG